MNPKVDWYFDKAEKWAEAIARLRTIVLETGVTEELKWGVPAYTLDGKNVALIHTFKDYCALLFPKGALLTDAHGILIQQTENVQAARQMRFTSAFEVVEKSPLITAYVLQAIEVETAGLKVPMKAPADFAVAEEFSRALAENASLKTAFDALTPGRQRAYLLHFSAPKQSKTRAARVEKRVPDILDGKGLNG